MGKIVGNGCFFILLFSVALLNANISLRVLDTDRSPLVQAGVGRPFLIEVSLQDVRTIGQPPVVKGLDQFVVRNSGVRITTMNSKVTAKYTFEVAIDKPGTYTIGPAMVTDKNQQESSQTVRLIVGNEQIESKKNNEKKE